MLELATEKNSEKEIYVIVLKGEIDSITASDFEKFFSQMVDGNYRFFILEASRLRSISSGGIAGLARFLRKLHEEGGAAAFCGPNREVHMLLDFFNISAHFPVFATVYEAEEYLSKQVAGRKHFLKLERGALLSSQEASGVKLRNPQGKGAFLDEKSDIPAKQESFSIRSRSIQGADRGNAPQRHARSSVEKQLRSKELSGLSISPEDSVIVCEQCGATMRVHKSGRHLCPECSGEFFVKRDGSVSYFEKFEN